MKLGPTAAARAIKDHVKERLSKHEYPRILEFIDEFPKTPKGNIKKRELIERSRG